MIWTSLTQYARGNKLFITASLGILTILSGLFHLNYLNARGILFEKFDQQIAHHHEMMIQSIYTENAKQREILEFLHHNPVIVKTTNDASVALDKNKNKKLNLAETKKILAPYHSKLLYLIRKNWPHYKVQLPNFHIQLTDKHISLVQLNAPNRYGLTPSSESDISISAFKKNTPQQGFELTDDGVISRTVLPIEYKDKILGTIELGLPLTRLISIVKHKHETPIRLKVTTAPLETKSNDSRVIFNKSLSTPLFGNASSSIYFHYTMPIKAQTQKLWDFYLFRAMHLMVIFIIANFAMAYIIKFYSRKLEEIIEFRTQRLREEVSHHRETSRKLEIKSKEAYLNTKYSEIGELASGIAHEINNPLMIIQASLFKLKRVTDSNAVVDPLIDACNRNVSRMSQIINSLKVYSRDGRDDQLQHVSIKSALDTALDLVQINLRHARVEFTSEITDDFKIYAQEVQLIQIFVNLIKNSCDAICDLEEKWINVSARKDEKNIYFTLTDSGAGIPKHLQSKIFMNFFTTKDVGKGTGLGLSLVQEIVQQHKGTIEIKSDEPNTTFLLTFPIENKLEEKPQAA